MSTPRLVTLPAGVVADRWAVRRTQRAVIHAGMSQARDWAILVPGFTGSKEDFSAMLPLLADAGMGAVAFDHLGQYESDASDRSGDYTLPLLASDLAEVATAAALRFERSDPPHVLGHSFGGLVAQESVANGQLRPASLLLLCSGPGGLPPARWGELPALVEALDRHDLATIWRIMRDMDESGTWDTLPPQVAAFLERRWHANSPVHLRECALMLMRTPVITDRLAASAVGLPTTVMWGEHDDAWPLEVQSRLARDLSAEGIQLAGLGHSPNAEDPERTVEALLRSWRPAG